MTVNKLIAELQTLSAQGHGELDVISAIPCELDHSTNIKVSHFIPESTEDRGPETYHKGGSYAQQHCIQIWVDDP